MLCISGFELVYSRWVPLNVVTANKFTKPSDAPAELWFCLLNLYQENMRVRPCLYREKFSRGHPPSPSQLKQVFI